MALGLDGSRSPTYKQFWLPIVYEKKRPYDNRLCNNFADSLVFLGRLLWLRPQRAIGNHFIDRYFGLKARRYGAPSSNNYDRHFLLRVVASQNVYVEPGLECRNVQNGRV